MSQPDPIEVAGNLLARIETDIKTVRALLTQNKPSEPEDFRKKQQQRKACPKCGSVVAETMGGTWACLDCGAESEGDE